MDEDNCRPFSRPGYVIDGGYQQGQVLLDEDGVVSWNDELDQLQQQQCINADAGCDFYLQDGQCRPMTSEQGQVFPGQIANVVEEDVPTDEVADEEITVDNPDVIAEPLPPQESTVCKLNGNLYSTRGDGLFELFVTDPNDTRDGICITREDFKTMFPLLDDLDIDAFFNECKNTPETEDCIETKQMLSSAEHISMQTNFKQCRAAGGLYIHSGSALFEIFAPGSSDDDICVSVETFKSIFPNKTDAEIEAIFSNSNMDNRDIALYQEYTRAQERAQQEATDAQTAAIQAEAAVVADDAEQVADDAEQVEEDVNPLAFNQYDCNPGDLYIEKDSPLFEYFKNLDGLTISPNSDRVCVNKEEFGFVMRGMGLEQAVVDKLFDACKGVVDGVQNITCLSQRAQAMQEVNRFLETYQANVIQVPVPVVESANGEVAVIEAPDETATVAVVVDQEAIDAAKQKVEDTNAVVAQTQNDLAVVAAAAEQTNQNATDATTIATGPNATTLDVEIATEAVNQSTLAAQALADADEKAEEAKKKNNEAKAELNRVSGVKIDEEPPKPSRLPPALPIQRVDVFPAVVDSVKIPQVVRPDRPAPLPPAAEGIQRINVIPAAVDSANIPQVIRPVRPAPLPPQVNVPPVVAAQGMQRIDVIPAVVDSANIPQVARPNRPAPLPPVQGVVPLAPVVAQPQIGQTVVGPILVGIPGIPVNKGKTFRMTDYLDRPDITIIYSDTWKRYKVKSECTSLTMPIVKYRSDGIGCESKAPNGNSVAAKVLAIPFDGTDDDIDKAIDLIVQESAGRSYVLCQIGTKGGFDQGGSNSDVIIRKLKDRFPKLGYFPTAVPNIDDGRPFKDKVNIDLPIGPPKIDVNALIPRPIGPVPPAASIRVNPMFNPPVVPGAVAIAAPVVPISGGVSSVLDWQYNGRTYKLWDQEFGSNVLSDHAPLMWTKGADKYLTWNVMYKMRANTQQGYLNAHFTNIAYANRQVTIDPSTRPGVISKPGSFNRVEADGSINIETDAEYETRKALQAQFIRNSVDSGMIKAIFLQEADATLKQNLRALGVTVLCDAGGNCADFAMILPVNTNRSAGTIEVMAYSKGNAQIVSTDDAVYVNIHPTGAAFDLMNANPKSYLVGMLTQIKARAGKSQVGIGAGDFNKAIKDIRTSLGTPAPFGIQLITATSANANAAPPAGQIRSTVHREPIDGFMTFNIGVAGLNQVGVAGQANGVNGVNGANRVNVVDVQKVKQADEAQKRIIADMVKARREGRPVAEALAEGRRRENALAAAAANRNKPPFIGGPIKRDDVGWRNFQADRNKLRQDENKLKNNIFGANAVKRNDFGAAAGPKKPGFLEGLFGRNNQPARANAPLFGNNQQRPLLGNNNQQRKPGFLEGLFGNDNNNRPALRVPDKAPDFAAIAADRGNAQAKIQNMFGNNGAALVERGMNQPQAFRAAQRAINTIGNESMSALLASINKLSAILGPRKAEEILRHAKEGILNELDRTCLANGLSLFDEVAGECIGVVDAFAQKAQAAPVPVPAPIQPAPALNRPPIAAAPQAPVRPLGLNQAVPAGAPPQQAALNRLVEARRPLDLSSSSSISLNSISPVAGPRLPQAQAQPQGQVPRLPPAF